MKGTYEKKVIINLELDELEYNTLLASFGTCNNANMKAYSERNNLEILNSEKTTTLYANLFNLKK